MEEEDRCAEKGTIGPVVIEETCVKSAFVKVMGGGLTATHASAHLCKITRQHTANRNMRRMKRA